MPLILSISAERISNKKFVNFNELDINLCYSESRIGLWHIYLFVYLFIVNIMSCRDPSFSNTSPLK